MIWEPGISGLDFSPWWAHARRSIRERMGGRPRMGGGPRKQKQKGPHGQSL